MRTRLYLAAAIVLIAGLAAGGAIYFMAEEEPTASAYLIIDGTAYAYHASRSKTYVLQLERFGGKAAVLFDEFNRWFASLWQGKALGVTIAWLSIGSALALLLIARRSGPD